MQQNGWSNTLSQWTSCGNKWNYRNKNLVAIYDIYCNDIFCCENLLPQSVLQRLATTNFRCDKSLLQQKISLQLTFFLVVQVTFFLVVQVSKASSSRRTLQKIWGICNSYWSLPLLLLLLFLLVLPLLTFKRSVLYEYMVLNFIACQSMQHIM